jgi:hypothetical protein
MSALTIVLLVVGLVVLILAIVLGTLRIVVGRVRKSSAEKIATRFGSEEVVRSDPMANFFGLESKGTTQIRGNGALVLTPTVLWFSRVGSSEPLEIPVTAIREVDLVSSHLGKTVGRKLLHVRFETPQGSDGVAWWTKDVEGWKEILRSAR